MHLIEQPEKMLYLVVTLALGVLSWLVLSVFASPALLPNSKVIKTELVLANARAKHAPFPVHYIPRIQQIPGVDNVHWHSLAAFFCADGSGATVAVIGWAGDVENELRQQGVSDTDLAMWHHTENGILAGSKISRRCGLMQGTTISPDNIFGNAEIPLYVVAVLPESGRSSNHVHAHYSYINRLMEGHLGVPMRDMVMRVIVHVKDPSKLTQIAQAIEQEFQSSDPPLEVIVPGDSNSLLGRFGQLQALLSLIMGAMALCVLLVFVAITAHLVAQRRASMAVLQTLGFNRQIQFFALLLELSGILVLGTLLGIATGYGALALLTPWAADTLFSGALHPADGAMLVLPPALLLLLLFTLVWPYLRISKLKPVDHLHF